MRMCLGALYSVILPLAAGASGAWAQAFPAKPVELIVHTGAGGGSDLFARVVAEIINREKLLPQPLVVVNKGGGGGALALTHIASRRGDPYTVLTVAVGIVLTAYLRTGLDIGPDKIQPLALLGFDLSALAVREDSPYRNVRDLVEAAKANPRSITFGVGSVGGTGHYFAYQIEKATGARFNIVSMKSGNAAVLAVLGGHVQATTENLSEMMQQVEAKQMRILGLPAERRVRAIPDVPTLKEQGLEIRLGSGRGFAAPAGVPKEAAAALEATFELVYKSAAWREHSTRNMFEDVYMNGAEFSRFLAGRQPELARYLHEIGLVQKKQ
jgi:putative tricarboxylic transport membrane protein